jgi:hypothetical protein
LRTTDVLVSARSRAIRRVLSCAAVAATLGAMTLTSATQAHAQSGRRVCGQNADTKTKVTEMWVVDHDKDSPCPTIKAGKNG